MLGTRTHEPDQTVDSRERVFRPWALVAAVIGLGAIALGVWALVKTGLDTKRLFGPRAEVLGLPHTPALALGEIGFGVLMLLAAASRTAGRLLMMILGVAAATFGVLVLTDTYTGHLGRWTAADDSTGWLYVIVGAVAIVAAAVLPTMRSRHSVVTDERAREFERVTPAEPRRQSWQSTHGSARA
jgi:hypothetical protein